MNPLDKQAPLPASFARMAIGRIQRMMTGLLFQFLVCRFRPMLLISDGADWTKNTPVVEFPFIRKIYELYGRESLVENAHFADGKHDYGFDKRQAAYRFLAKHLKLNADPVLTGEGWVRILATEDLRVTRLQ